VAQFSAHFSSFYLHVVTPPKKGLFSQYTQYAHTKKANFVQLKKLNIYTPSRAGVVGLPY
jgi:hypothetical protein